MAQKVRKSFLIFAVGVIILILSLTVVKPTFEKVLRLSSRNKADKEKLAQLKDKVEKLEAIDKDEIKRRVKLVEEIFPSEKPVLNLVNSLEQLSAEEEVVFGGITLEPGEIKEDLKSGQRREFPISFNIEGKLEKISSFVNSLEKAPPLMKIEEMNLTIKNKGGEGKSQTSELLTSKLGVRVYYQAPPETIGAVDQPLPLLTKEELAILKRLDSYRLFTKVEPTAPTGKENLFSLP